METSFGRDLAVATVNLDPVFEPVEWKCDWLCEKWSEDAVNFVRRKLGFDKHVDVSSFLLRRQRINPEEEIEVHGNLLLNTGINQLLDALIGAGGLTAFNNANARLGVGDSTTAAAATQTDLQAATNKTYKAMNATYPSRAAQVMSWQSDFVTGDANYAWQEYIIDNGATAAVRLNRKVTSLGTKATGTWTLTATVTLA